MFVLGTVTIDGFAPEEAQAIAKSFWGRVWGAIKAAVRAVMDAITFDGGPYLGTCRADVQVTHVDGVPVGGTVGMRLHPIGRPFRRLVVALAGRHAERRQK